MPELDISVSHSLTQTEAVQRLKNLLEDVGLKFASDISHLSENWNHHVGNVRASVQGFPVSAVITVTAGSVKVICTVPPEAMIFRRKIETTTKQHIEAVLA